MGQIIRVEKYQRGFFGKLFKYAFILFNVLMLFWVVGGFISASGGIGKLSSDAERAGAAIGTAMGIGLLLTLWVIGDIILGLFVMFTRGKKVITETIT